jgi:predicted adenylyl cyclase CyaB
MSELNIQIVEIKARNQDLSRARARLEKARATYIGLDTQTDTYFNCSNGRLKLREGEIESRLIQYCRSEVKDLKLSEVKLYDTPDPSTLKQLLVHALGVKTVVFKKRHIFFIDRVKFHLDEVKGLGSFVEIEVIDKSGKESRSALDKICQHYMDLLDIKKEDLVDASYSDLLLS